MPKAITGKDGKTYYYYNSSEQVKRSSIQSANTSLLSCKKHLSNAIEDLVNASGICNEIVVNGEAIFLTRIQEMEAKIEDLQSAIEQIESSMNASATTYISKTSNASYLWAKNHNKI